MRTYPSFVAAAVLCLLRLPLAAQEVPALPIAGTAVPASQPDKSAPGQPDARKAIEALEANLAALRNAPRDRGAFVSQFQDMSAKHPCDVCPDMELMPVENYAFKVAGLYPDTFGFTYQIIERLIQLESFSDGSRLARIPYTKRFALPAQGGGGRERVVHLIAELRMAPEDGRWRMRTVLQEKPPGPNQLMLELGAGMGLGAGDLAEVFPGAAPSISSSRMVMGVAYYFHPGGPNRSNIWLRTGLRVMLRTDRLEQERLDTRETLQLTPSQPQPPTTGHRIDALLGVSGVEEQVRRVQLQVPLGLSKRWDLNDRLCLALEGELSYGIEVMSRIIGRYTLDLSGTEHYLNGEPMDASGGSPVVYTGPDASLDDAAGVRHEFFTGRQAVLDDIELTKAPGLGFALRPGLFVKQSGRLRYHAGLELAWVANPGVSPERLTSGYFLHTTDNSRPSLTSMDARKHRPFIGFTLGLTL